MIAFEFLFSLEYESNTIIEHATCALTFELMCLNIDFKLALGVYLLYI